MTPDEWLALASHDARRRGLADLVPLLESVHAAIRAVRETDEDGAGGDAGSGRGGTSASS